MLKRLANFSFNWKLSIFTLLLFPVLISLGNWQLSREQEKLALQEVYALRQAAPPISIVKLNRQNDIQYMRLQLRGQYDNEHSFLLDNKVNVGQVGFDVITPFYADTNELFFINRGWAAQGQYRSDYPVIEPVVGMVNLNAAVYVPVGRQVMLGVDAESSSWPRLIQSLEPVQMMQQLNVAGTAQGFEYFPYSLRLAENAPGVQVRNWPLISTSPEKHRGYAVQWFLMAAVLLLLYFWVSTTKKDITERRKKVGE